MSGNVTSIRDNVFFNCSSLTSISIPNSVTSIGNYAFYYCSGLTTLIIPNSITTIGDFAFTECSNLTTVNFNATNCTKMGHVDGVSAYPVFYKCPNLTTINIGNNVTNIPVLAFAFCTGLTEITIPSSVNSIGDYAFNTCSSLTSVTNLNPMPQTISAGVFGGVNISNATLTVPCPSLSQYQAAPVWQDFGTISGGAGCNTQYTVSVSSNNTAWGTASGGGTFDEYASVTVTATPNSGYQFVNWTENGAAVSTSASYTFTLTSDRTLVANFTAITYALTVNNGTGGGSYESGTVVNISANVAPAGQEFDQWTGDVSGVANVTAANTTYTVGNSNAVVTATYKLITGVEPVDAGIKIYAEGSTVRIESGIPMKSVEVYNALGQAIRLVRTDFNRAQIDNLPSGVLVVKVSLQSGKVEIKKIGTR